MSIYNDASLAMIPSAYKDGKLYSLRPTDGSGDFTFSRGSNLAATRVDVNGLIEKGRENLLLQSNQFNTTWSDFNGASGQAGYDGSNDAWRYDSSSSVLRLQQVGLSFSGVHTYSIYAKYVDAQWFALQIAGSTNESAWFDIQNGTLGSTSSAVDSSITSVGGGWYRCSVTGSASNQNRVRLYVVGSDGSLANITASLLIQDAQIEAGLVATDYIETGASTAQAGILEDMPRLDYSGSCPALLLEPQRTNIVPHSEYIGDASWGKNVSGGTLNVTSNYGISPDGSKNATRIEASITSGYADIVQVLGTSSGTAYTYSVYLKSLSGTPSIYFIYDGTANRLITLTTEWKKYTFKIPSAPTIVYPRFLIEYGLTSSSIDILAYGAQLEQGSYPTSYIPTYGSSVTRSSESQATDYGVLGGGQVGSIFVEFERFAIDTSWTGAFTQLVSSGGSEEIRLHFDAPTAQARWRDANNSYIDIGGAISTAVNSRIKTILTSDGNTIKVFANGSKIGSDYTIVNPLEFDKLVNLQRGAMNVYSEMYFPTALTDSECIALTTL